MDTMTRDRESTMALLVEYLGRINNEEHVFEIDGGRKYVRVMHEHAKYGGSSVHMFVGMADGIWGDIYKPANLKAPALNGARYNLFDDGVEAIAAAHDWAGGYLYKR
jgi:hypothetical protein